MFGVGTVLHLPVCRNVMECAPSLPNNSVLVGSYVNAER